MVTVKKWNEELWLLTINEYNELPDNTQLKCIDDEIVIKGNDYIDLDTRFGVIAYGLTLQLVKDQNLDYEFLLMMLRN